MICVGGVYIRVSNCTLLLVGSVCMYSFVCMVVGPPHTLCILRENATRYLAAQPAPLAESKLTPQGDTERAAIRLFFPVPNTFSSRLTARNERERSKRTQNDLFALPQLKCVGHGQDQGEGGLWVLIPRFWRPGGGGKGREDEGRVRGGGDQGSRKVLGFPKDGLALLRNESQD